MSGDINHGSRDTAGVDSAVDLKGVKALRNPNALLRAAARRVTRSVPELQSSFDGLQGGGITGWVWEPRQLNQRTRVGLYVDDALISERTADNFRQDLMDAGIGDGAHAFWFDLSDVLASDDRGSFLTDFTPRRINVRTLATGTPLNGPTIEMSPATLFLSAAVGFYSHTLSGSIEPVEYGDV